MAAGDSGGGCDGDGGGDAAVKAMQDRMERERDLQAFELLGMIIGANLYWDKVSGGGGREKTLSLSGPMTK